jgi:penicillin-binding protein 1A
MVRLLLGASALAAVAGAAGFYHVYLDRSGLPDLEGFKRFEFPTVGTIYDAHGQPLKEMASESRRITRYDEIPPIVRDAILAAEDKNFFSHSGVDYTGFARVLCKVRFGKLFGRLWRMGARDAVNNAAIFPQGGSTITQQLVRGYFLKTAMAQENSDQVRHGGWMARVISCVIGARTVNMMVRKVEEIRLSLWVEDQMREHFGSKRRAKEEILARYASLIYMGNGQYGIARGADYYFGRPLGMFTAEDADKAALLAGIAKSARFYAPSATETKRVLQRRNQTLALMAARGFISSEQARRARARPIEVVEPHKDKTMTEASAAVDNVIDELTGRQADLSVKDLLQGRIQVYSTVDTGVQVIANQALERGLLLYEKRHPGARGVTQGSVVVLRNRDASILAETGGREFYKDRSSAYVDFNRVTKSLRQPGSAMKPIVYLAAFQEGTFNLETVVPDEPISVPNGMQDVKWISNYDGQFKGPIPLRMALAESRNAVAIWITEQIGVASVQRTARTLGIQTPLRPYATTALGASEVNLLELANAYRTIASGILTQPYIIRKIVRDSGETIADSGHPSSPVRVAGEALSLIQEGLRSVVRMPSGTAHALDSRAFPIAVMGKTGTTNGFRDALFVGSTYGPEGITVAVRIGFDDNRSLGSGETGGRVALPVFKEVLLRAYGEKLLGPAPRFPAEMEQHISAFLEGSAMVTAVVTEVIPPSPVLIRTCPVWPLACMSKM